MKITVFEPKPNENIRKFGVSFEYHIARNYLTIRISREIGKLPNAQNVNGFISVVLRETRKSNFLCTFNNAIGISRVPVRFRQNRLRNIKDAGPSSTGRTGGRTRRNYTGAIIRFLRFHHGTLKTGSSFMGIFFFFFMAKYLTGVVLRWIFRADNRWIRPVNCPLGIINTTYNPLLYFRRTYKCV